MSDFSGDTSPADNVSASSPHEPFDDSWSYETSVSQVEAIINQIEMGELELAEVFDRFAIAVEHLHHCEAFLTHQKKRMDLLIETLLDEPDVF
ncbi:MAG TPA: exodeoxyribonuclease VII small subunit [Crinalium sp.]|jgi:exodeoxyribonuclease VII small subunit